MIHEPVNDEILDCLNIGKQKSFFLFAGAGSGKTGSLVTVLQEVNRKYGKSLKLRGKKIGVITYTNAACDEINSRLDHDSLFFVSTIHSFAWELIKSYQEDIRQWLIKNLKDEISTLNKEER